MAKGFGGMPGNMQGLMQQAQKMQQKLQEVQQEAETMTSEGSAGGGVVKVVANGKNTLVSVTIDPQVINPADAEMLQDLVLLAANDALTKVQNALKEKMASVTGGLNIPGLF